MCAIEFDPEFKKTAWDLCMLLKDEGILCKPTKKNIIRFSPPLVIT
jgi:ornithine--oxo-acid transaminase